ncbi:glutamate carboxypeptidase II [Malassezia obtusa]|uniref:Glutamate carboxypeptidase II n=1 Tax=Malassezia obtusa TaxID=76774 RepID=A0AAF0ISM6_9BASI|nr:glutamate carboxypeptidase II [Malassezia obtusa]
MDRRIPPPAPLALPEKEPVYEDEDTYASARRRSRPARLVLCVALLLAAALFWPRSGVHRCAHDAPLGAVHDAVRWEHPACRVRGQTHGDACRTSFEARNRAAEAAFLAQPKAASARDALRRYTAAPHLASDDADYASALGLIEEWSALLGLPAVANASAHVHDAGSAASRALWAASAPRDEPTTRPRVWADTYSVWLDRPVHAALGVRDARGAALWDADLAEDVLREDPTSAHGVPPFHGYSHAGNASGALVYAGAGHPEDFARLAAHGVEVRGAVVLVRYGGLFRGLKVRAAQEAGAVGVLIYSDVKEDDVVTEAHGHAAYPAGPAREPSSVQRGSVQALSLYPGDPGTPGEPSYRNATRLRRDEADSLPRIPSLPISARNAQRLLAHLAGHGVRASALGAHFGGALPGAEYWTGPSRDVVHLSNEMAFGTRDIWNVYAVIPGYIDDQRVVLGNHRDAWTFGAVDPSSGGAVVHEVLKGLGALVQRGWKPMRTLVVASWDAEEYGLVGSTEFGEDYAAHLADEVALYLNLDMAVGGSELSAAASPSLAALLRGAAANVSDAHGPLALPKIAALGSGSDYTVFLQRLGIASLDVSYRRAHGDPVYHYHSNYDSFAWMTRFGDPDFARHEALAKLFGLTALRAAQAPFLPLDVLAYAHELYTYHDRALDAAHGRDAEAHARLRAAIDRVAHAARTHAEAQAALDARFRALLARDAPHRPSPALRAAMHEVRGVNRALQRFERGFLDARGLPHRPWYRHLGVAPGRWLGYGATTFPGVVEAYTLDGGARAAEEIARLTAALERIADGLRVPTPRGTP